MPCTRGRRLFSAIALGAAISVGITPIAEAGISVQDAFNGLVSSATGAGYYSTGSRNVFVAGTFRVWVPSQTVQLVSLTPPPISAGCSGISMNFGGMSFISGHAFQKLVKNIMQAAPGYVIYLAIGVLCPLCKDVLSTLQALAQKANQLGLNSCAVARGMLSSAAKDLTQMAGNHGLGAGLKNFCSTTSAVSGASSSFLSAMSNACSSASSALSAVDTFAAGGENKASQVASIHGNKEWIGLTNAGFSNTSVKELLLSVTGFSVIGSKSGQGGAPAPAVYPGWVSQKTLDGKTNKQMGSLLLMLLLFGNDPARSLQYLEAGPSSIWASATPRMQAALEGEFAHAVNNNYQALPFYLCRSHAGGPGGSLDAPMLTPVTMSGVAAMCDDPVATTVGAVTSAQNALVGGYGLYVDVWSNLQKAVKRIELGQPIPLAAIRLMQMTPLPVYQMVNVAAVYPAAATQLVKTYSYFISVLIAEAIVEQWVSMPTDRTPGRASAGLQASRAVQALAEEIGASVSHAKGALSQALATQQRILASLKLINHEIFQQMVGNGMQGNLLFTQGLASGLASGH